MRCIEMNTVNVMLEAVSMININMRCIEINMNENQNCQWYWLTLTWDVLKFKKGLFTGFVPIRLTLTWDVLKYTIFSVI